MAYDLDRVPGEDLGEGGLIGEIDPVKAEPGVLSKEESEPGLFQGDIVVIVHVVHADHPITTAEEGVTHVETNEARGTGNEIGSHL